jgi:hypothetical protein
MKTQTAVLNKISQEHLNSLTDIVSETIASGFGEIPKKPFTAAELWSIQRRSRSASRRSFYL